MKRRTFIKGTSVAAMAVALGIPWNLFSKGKKLNIVVLLADDQRFDTINALGNKDIRTPNLDFLVKNGTAFTQAHVMGGLSGAICQPSRAMILTGRTLFDIDRQARDNQDFSFDVFNNYITFPELLRNNGYATIGIGKQHNGPQVYSRAFTDGAKIFFGGMSDQYKIPHQDFAGDGKYPTERMYYSEGKHSAEIYTDETIHFINKYKSEPFLIYTAFQSPHDPRTCPKEFIHLYDEKKLKLPPNFLPQHPFDIGSLKVRDELLAGFPRTEEEVRKHLRDYYAIISHLDHQVGRIIKSIKDNGLEENTLVVFAGDNGLAVGQHGLLGKQNLYEHSNRVPLLFWGAGIPKNKQVDGLCYLSDIFPTIASQAEINIPESVQGISLTEGFKNSNAPLRPSLYFVYKHFQRGVKKDGFKLIEYNVDGVRHTQLFDLKKDPWEMVNHADNPAYQTIKKDLKQELLTLKVKYNDNFSTFWKGYDS